MGELIKSAAKTKSVSDAQKETAETVSEHTELLTKIQKLSDELSKEVHADQKAVAGANKLAKKTRDALVTAVKVLARRIGQIEELTNKQIVLTKTLEPREDMETKINQLVRD